MKSIPPTGRRQPSVGDAGSLKRHARKEREKFPPLGEQERRRLEQIWRLTERQARFAHRAFKELCLLPWCSSGAGSPPGQRARRAMETKPNVQWQPRRFLDWYEPAPGNSDATRQSQDYWASYRKCAACPGPNRRQGKFPFGTGPNAGHTPDGEPT